MILAKLSQNGQYEKMRRPSPVRRVYSVD